MTTDYTKGLAHARDDLVEFDDVWVAEHLEDLNLTTDLLSHVQAVCVYVCMHVCVYACVRVCVHVCMGGIEKQPKQSQLRKDRQKFRAENGSGLNGPIVDHGQVRWSLGGTHDLVLLGQTILCT